MKKVTYSGMDVHLNSIAVVWGKAKEKPRTVVVPNTEEGIEALVRAVGTQDVWGMYEASSCGFEVYDRLTQLGWKMSIVAPTHIAKSVQGRKRKTDLRDAKRLWEILMSHGELGTELAEVWIPDAELREEREVVRRRLKLGESQCRVKNGILSLLRIHKIRRPKEMKTAWTQKHVAWLRGLLEEGRLGTHLRTVLGSFLRELEFVEKEVNALQKGVEALAEVKRYEKQVEKMVEMKGVGILTAMTFLVELGDVHRFGNRRQVASYLGLVPASYESGEANDRKGHITRLGPARVRKILNQAAWHVMRGDPVWRARYGRIGARRGKKKSIVALMRLLGIELWQRAKSA